MQRRVFITGIGVVSAAGVGADAFWAHATAGAPTLSAAPPEIRAAGAGVIGAVRDFSGAAYLRNERHARVLTRSFELLVGAGALAAADAALHATPVPPPRLGVVVGIGPIEQHTPDLLEALRRAEVDGRVDVERFGEAARSMYPLRRLRLLPNVGTGAALDRASGDGPEPDARERSRHGPASDRRRARDDP